MRDKVKDSTSNDRKVDEKFTVEIVDDESRPQRRFVCSATQSLLEAYKLWTLLGAGGHAARLPYACKVGGCGLCKIRVLQGTFRLGTCSKTALTPEEREQGIALACKTYPESDLRIAFVPAAAKARP